MVVGTNGKTTVTNLLADALEAATEALENLGDYDNLDNKPQIDGVTLSGNQTPVELGLQKALTAGENVTIYENGVISATGIVKYKYMTTQIDDCIEDGVIYAIRITELQSNAQVIAKNDYTTISQYALLNDGRLMYRMRQGQTPWQPAGEWSAWEEIGGSEIASGVVNQNGTISFYDAGGNLLFTTTGTSVIGPQGAPGNDYVLTAQDKADIADIVLQELPTTQGVLYGNAGN